MISNEKYIREKIVSLALDQHHKKYVHGGHGNDNYDCAGLVWYIYNELLNIDMYEQGFGLSTTTMIMTSKYGKIVLFEENLNKNLDNIKFGDILLFHRQALDDTCPLPTNKYPGHCGIYLGNNSFIHASKPMGKVVISSFDSDYWKRILIGNKNVIDDSKVLKKTNS